MIKTNFMLNHQLQALIALNEESYYKATKDFETKLKEKDTDDIEKSLLEQGKSIENVLENIEILIKATKEEISANEREMLEKEVTTPQNISEMNKISLKEWENIMSEVNKNISKNTSELLENNILSEKQLKTKEGEICSNLLYTLNFTETFSSFNGSKNKTMFASKENTIIELKIEGNQLKLIETPQTEADKNFLFSFEQKHITLEFSENKAIISLKENKETLDSCEIEGVVAEGSRAFSRGGRVFLCFKEEVFQVTVGDKLKATKLGCSEGRVTCLAAREDVVFFGTDNYTTCSFKQNKSEVLYKCLNEISDLCFSNEYVISLDISGWLGISEVSTMNEVFVTQTGSGAAFFSRNTVVNVTAHNIIVAFIDGNLKEKRSNPAGEWMDLIENNEKIAVLAGDYCLGVWIHSTGELKLFEGKQLLDIYKM